MPLPLLIAGAAAVAGTTGVVKGAKAISNNHEAKELIEQADQLSEHQIETFGEKAKERIKTAYSWRSITDRYEEIFMKRDC